MSHSAYQKEEFEYKPCLLVRLDPLALKVDARGQQGPKLTRLPRFSQGSDIRTTPACTSRCEEGSAVENVSRPGMK